MNPITSYHSIDVGYPVILRGTNQQTTTGLIRPWPTYAGTVRGMVGSATRAATLRVSGVALGSFDLHAPNGNVSAVGLGVRIPNHLWIAGAWDNSETTAFTDDTTDAQDTDSGDVALETTTVNDGFVIASRVWFNAVSINVATASVGGTPVRAVRFTNSAGSGWNTAITNFYLQHGAAANWSTGEQVIAWAPQYDWGMTQAGGLSGIPEGYYAMNCRATTAPSVTAGAATALEIFRLYFLTELDFATYSKDFGAKDFVMAVAQNGEIYGDGLVAFFSTADDQNRVTAQVRWL